MSALPPRPAESVHHLKLYLRALRVADAHLVDALAFGRHTPSQRTLLQLDRHQLNGAIQDAVSRVGAAKEHGR